MPSAGEYLTVRFRHPLRSRASQPPPTVPKAAFVVHAVAPDPLELFSPILRRRRVLLPVLDEDTATSRSRRSYEDPRQDVHQPPCSSSSISRCPDNSGVDPDRPFNRPLDVQRATVVILGARGVGKTSLACQFVRSEFSDSYQPTASHAFYYVSILINERIYEVKLIDCSAVTRFPSNSLQEWNEYRGYGLRTASAYLLVYDATDEDSFRYVRSMRDQILRSRNTHDVPIFVAANKQDLQATAAAAGAAAGDRGPGSSASKRGGGGGGGGDLASVVKKQWKCGFVECSTKHNWRVTTVFKELIKAVDHVRYGHRQASTRAIQDALRNNHCAIL